MLLEICANSYQSAINAEKAGANRVELCVELAVGGITPSYGFLKKTAKRLSIPIHVLIRPRSGDFTYSDDEFEIMKENIILCKKLGVSGIVSGILLIDNTIDFERTHELIELAKPMSFTFHRAFDWVKNPVKSITGLEEIGAEQILSSGQEITAEKGIHNLLKWQQISTKITIIPGGGIHAKNINHFQENGFQEVHLSASSFQKTIEIPKISMQSPQHFDETKLAISDIEKIKNCIQGLKIE